MDAFTSVHDLQYTSEHFTADNGPLTARRAQQK